MYVKKLYETCLKKNRRMGIIMELKKKLSVATVLLASTFVLVACGNGADKASSSSEAASTSEVASSSSEATSTSTEATTDKLVDGTYTLETNADKRGWATKFVITVKDGKITESDYDNFNDKGERKSADKAYQESMAAKTNGVGPEQYFKAYNEGLVTSQDPAKVEVVTGATHSHESFVEYAEKLIEAAKKGDTTTIKVEIPAE